MAYNASKIMHYHFKHKINMFCVHILFIMTIIVLTAIKSHYIILYDNPTPHNT